MQAACLPLQCNHSCLLIILPGLIYPVLFDFDCRPDKDKDKSTLNGSSLCAYWLPRLFNSDGY